MKLNVADVESIAALVGKSVLNALFDFGINLLVCAEFNVVARGTTEAASHDFACRQNQHEGVPVDGVDDDFNLGYLRHTHDNHHDFFRVAGVRAFAVEEGDSAPNVGDNPVGNVDSLVRDNQNRLALIEAVEKIRKIS